MVGGEKIIQIHYYQVLEEVEEEDDENSRLGNYSLFTVGILYQNLNNNCKIECLSHRQWTGNRNIETLKDIIGDEFHCH